MSVWSAFSNCAASGATVSLYSGSALSAALIASHGVQVVIHKMRPSCLFMQTRSEVPQVAKIREPTTTGDDALKPGSFVIQAMFFVVYSAGNGAER